MIYHTLVKHANHYTTDYTLYITIITILLSFLTSLGTDGLSKKLTNNYSIKFFDFSGY